MAEKSNTFVVDASFVLSFLIPDEDSRFTDDIFEQFQKGEIKLISTKLLSFEVINGVRSAVLRKRLDEKIAKKLIKAFLNLEIKLVNIDYYKTFKLALKENLSIYDTTYLYLARSKKLKLLTLDEKLQKLSK